MGKFGYLHGSFRWCEEFIWFSYAIWKAPQCFSNQPRLNFLFFCLLFVWLMPNLCRGAISGRCYQNRPLDGSRDTDTGVFSVILSVGCWIYDGAKWLTEFKATLFKFICLNWFPFFLHSKRNLYLGYYASDHWDDIFGKATTSQLSMIIWLSLIPIKSKEVWSLFPHKICFFDGVLLHTLLLILRWVCFQRWLISSSHCISCHGTILFLVRFM